MKVPRVLRLAPFSSLVLASWLCMGIGGVFEWNMYEGLGLIWRILIIPSYVVFMLAVVAARPLGAWATIPVLIGLLIAGDIVINLLRRMSQVSTTRAKEK